MVYRRDRLASTALLAIGVVAWIVVAWLFTTFSPRGEIRVQLAGAATLGVAFAATLAPLIWLAAFSRRGRIAYRGEWAKAARRAAWVGLVVALFVMLRGQGTLALPVAMFVIVLVVFVELTLSFRR